MANNQNKLEDESLGNVIGGMGINEYTNIVRSFNNRGDSARIQVEVLLNGQWVRGTLVAAYACPVPRSKALDASYTVLFPDGKEVCFKEHGDGFNLRVVK